MSCVRPCCLRPAIRVARRHVNCTRVFSSSSPVCKKADPDEDDDLDDLVALAARGAEPERQAEGVKMKYDDWIATEGQKWRYPDALGPKWLGNDVPFPLNLTFKPPTPVSDALRTAIYTSYIMNPVENDVRTLSSRYGIAIPRIEAIIRLKELEEHWKKSKPLQTGFLKGMERLLGLNVGGQMTPIADEIKSDSRREVAAADENSRQTIEIGQDNKRSVSKTFFEPVDEGQSPLVSQLLDVERLKIRDSKEQRRQYPTTIVQPDPQKPAFRFVDVGLRWVDRVDMARRAKESTRRKMVKRARKARLGNNDRVTSVDNP